MLRCEGRVRKIDSQRQLVTTLSTDGAGLGTPTGGGSAWRAVSSRGAAGGGEHSGPTSLLRVAWRLRLRAPLKRASVGRPCP